MEASSLKADTTGRAGPVSIRAWLVLLVLAVLAPAILLVVILFWDAARTNLHNQERQLAATARALSLVVDRQLSEQIGLAEALAVSRPLRQGQYAEFDRQAREALHASSSWVVVRDADNQLLVNTMSSSDLSQPDGRTPSNVVTWAGARGGVEISNLFVGAAARRPIMVVRKPLTLADGREGDLNIVTAAETFREILQKQDLPEGWVASILDREGRIVARNRGGPDLVGRLATPDLLERMRRNDAEVRPSRNLEGVATHVAINRLSDVGWTALIAVPTVEITGPVRRAAILAMTVGAVLLAVSVLLALYVARRIARPVVSLARAAEGWVEGSQAPFPASTDLAETDSLARALEVARIAAAEHDDRQQLLINELNHRVKNTLATVQAITRHSLSGDVSANAFQAAVEGRLMAMSAAHDLLNSTSWAGAELGDLARLTLRPFAGPKLQIEGPTAQVTPSDALNLSLIFYELATNAAKHGALSTEAGAASLTWAHVDEGVRLVWTEAGGPPVSEPSRKGFGSRLIRQALKGLEPSEIRYDPAGVVCMMTLRRAVG